MDGDSRATETSLRTIASTYGHSVKPLFLPGDDPPEKWLWDTLSKRSEDYASRLGLTTDDMGRKLRELEQLLAGTVQQRDFSKTALRAFAADLNRSVPDIARIVGQREADLDGIPELVVDLKDQIGAWRQL